MTDNVITRERSRKKSSLIENKVFYEKAKDDLFSTVCLELGNDLNICKNCKFCLEVCPCNIFGINESDNVYFKGHIKVK